MERPRVVVITGASGGVGRAAARHFGQRGAAVGLLARGHAGLESAAEDVRSAGGRALPLSVDVADADGLAEAAGRIEEELGPTDVWINAAMTSVLAPFTELSPEEFERVTKVTYLGTVNGTKAALDVMGRRDRGTIVFVGSALAYRGIPLQSAYCGAKHGIQGFYESLRAELLHESSGVRVTMVQLPALNTPQFRWVLSRLPRRPQPVPPIFQPEVAARAVGHAADHPHRREYWVGGSTVGTIVGNKIAGGLLDRYLARTGYNSQQTGESQPVHAPANLWRPVDEDQDFGAHGAFDDRSAARSYQAWLSRHHGLLSLVGGGLAVLGSGWLLRRAISQER